MYRFLLAEIFKEQNCTSEIEKKKFLKRLSSEFIQLRDSYRGNYRKLDYSDVNVQYAYLLGYFPIYTEFLSRVLKNVQDSFDFSDVNDLILCGGGPCPEIISLINYFNKANIQQNQINISVIDNCPDNWESSMRIVSRYIRSKHSISINQHIFLDDYTREGFRLGYYQSTPKLLVFQNTLSEVLQNNYDSILINIIQALKDLPEDSFLIVIDFDFHVIREIYREIETLFSEYIEIRSGNLSWNSEMTQDSELLKNNFFTTREKARTKAKLKYLVIQKLEFFD